jgi:hypothetical protein
MFHVKRLRDCVDGKMKTGACNSAMGEVFHVEHSWMVRLTMRLRYIFTTYI